MSSSYVISSKPGCVKMDEIARICSRPLSTDRLCSPATTRNSAKLIILCSVVQQVI